MTLRSDNTEFSIQPPRKKNTRPFLTSVIWGFVVFALLLAGFAGFSQAKNVASFFPLRSLGSFHSQFELKWFDLQDYVSQNGGVDVVLIGNSTVNTGIDPSVFRERYHSLTGQDLRIFNFGVEGLTVESLSDVAKLIEDRYHPGTIILFTEMRDYIAANGAGVSQQFLSNPWMQYVTGDFSALGFLIDRLGFLNYLLPYRNWSNSDFLDTYRFALYRQGNLTSTGYEPEMYQEYKGYIPDPTGSDEQIKYSQSANFTLDPNRVRDLQDIISLQQSSTHVYVTEIPFYPAYYIYFGDPSVRGQYLADITAIVQQSGSVFIPAIDESLIPLSGRADDHHLNYIGAPVYSKLLARQFYLACKEHGFCLFRASGVNGQ